MVNDDDMQSKKKVVENHLIFLPKMVVFDNRQMVKANTNQFKNIKP